MTSITAGPESIMASINKNPIATTLPSTSSDTSIILLQSPKPSIDNSAYILLRLGGLLNKTTTLAVQMNKFCFVIYSWFLLFYDQLVARVRIKNSLHIRINQHVDWAFFDSGASKNYMSAAKADHHDLVVNPHPAGLPEDIKIFGETMKSIGSVTVITGIVGESETNSVQEFLVVPHCVKPLTMGMPFLNETKSLLKEHIHRRKAPPLMSDLMALMTLASYFSFLPIIIFGLWILNVFISTTEQSEAKLQRLAIKLIKDATSKAVHAIPDTGSEINCMPKAVADEMGYHIKSHWWNRRFIRNAAGHLFLTEGTVEEKIQIGDLHEEHEVLFHVVKEIDVHVVGRDFVDHHGVFEEKYSSAMIHDTKPKAHELFQLYKDHGLTAWIRHGWRKLVGKQKKDNRAILDQSNEQMKRIKDEDMKRAENKRLAVVQAAEPPLTTEASGGLQIDSQPPHAIEISTHAPSLSPEATALGEEHIHGIAESNQDASPSSSPSSPTRVNSLDLPPVNTDQSSIPAEAVFVGEVQPTFATTTPDTLENSASILDATGTAEAALDASEAFPSGGIDNHSSETQTWMLSPAEATPNDVEGVISEALGMDTPNEELSFVHSLGNAEPEVYSSPTAIVNGDASRVPDLDRLDPTRGSSKAPSSDGFHDSTHNTPRRSGSFVKESGNSLEHVSIPSPLHTSIPLIPDNSMDEKAVGSDL